MTLRTFWQLTRIQTLPAALMSPIAGVCFALYTFGRFHWLPTLLFFIGLALINLFVSAWNNLMDYLKAADQEYRSKSNIIAVKEIPLRLAWTICLTLLGLDTIIGAIVVWLTNLAILPVGGLAFLIAIFYTYGPFAFSRFPLGELLAGLCEGAFGFFMGIYVNSYEFQYFFIKFDGWQMTWTWDLAVLIPIVMVAFMYFCMNFNVMLSDNICDLTQDVKNERYTLVWYLKTPWALRLYTTVYILAALAVLAAASFRVLPLWSLLMLAIAPLVVQNSRKFLAKQVKSETFLLQVHTLMLYNGALSLTLILGTLFT